MEINALTRLARGSGVGLDIVVQFLLFLRNLLTVVLALLDLVDLQSEDLEVEFEDLVLDLAGLEGLASG